VTNPINFYSFIFFMPSPA